MGAAGLVACTIEPVLVEPEPEDAAPVDARDTDLDEVDEPLVWPPSSCEELARLPHTVCGGNPAGRWEILRLCYDVATTDPRNIVSVCGSDALVDGQGEASGEIDIDAFGDWGLLLLDVRIDAEIEFPLTCVSEDPNEARGVCSGRYFNGECELVGEICRCSTRQEASRAEESGIWNAQSGAMIVDLFAAPAPIQHTYCVRQADGLLDLRRLGRSDSTGWRAVARRVE